MTVIPKSPIGKLIKKNLGEMSLSEAAKKMAISRSYLSEIISGTRIPEINSCNKIADGLGIARTQIYRVMGWLDLEKDSTTQLQELIQNDPNLEELVKIYAQFDTPERRRMAVELLRVLLNNQYQDLPEPG